MVLGLGVAAAALEKLYQMQILGASAGPPESEPVRARSLSSQLILHMRKLWSER